MMRARPDAALRRRFVDHVRHGQLIPADTTVLVALSGGLDSTVLLHLLRFGDLGVRLIAAHLDHAMRPQSAGDAAWVRGLCTAWEVPLRMQRVGSAPHGERAARDVRYAFLGDAAAASGASVIVTAHHADDQAETVLFRLARGTGTTGLAGIPERRGLFVRPLLPFARAELLSYAKMHRVRWREDASNDDLVFARNRIRHVVIPALEQVHAGAARNIAALAARAAEADSAWSQIVRTALEQVVVTRASTGFALARDRLLAYDPHIRARVLRRLLTRLGVRPDAAVTKVALEFMEAGRSGTGVMLGSGATVEREFDTLWVGRRSPPDPPAGDPVVEIGSLSSGVGAVVAGGRRYNVRWGRDESPENAGAGLGRHPCSASFDPSLLRFPLVVRAWRPGDRIRMEYGSKKLKKLFQERRISRSTRVAVPVVTDATDEVLWIPGVARSSRAVPGSAETFTITVGDGEPV